MKHHINRRDFLRRSLLAAATFAVSPSKLMSWPQEGLQRQGAPKKVIVIGAGLAGLVVGYELTQAGHEVTILEARLRPGGRVYTLREPFSDGMYAEAGAARIPDHHHWTIKYVKLFGLTLDPFHPNSGANLSYLICTIPFSVLKGIEIVPPFSPEKQRAIAEQSYDSVTRIYLQTRTRYWESEGLNGFAITDLPEEIWHPTFDQPGRRGILVSYQSGAQAQQMAAMRENERTNGTLERMEKIFPGLRNNFEGGTTICWDEDEWARGALSILKPGEMFSLLPHIAKPEGRVHFAGEHTSAWPGWMQGALESGHRAAHEVNEAS